MKDARMEGTSDIREIKVLGDWAYLRNYFTITMTPPGGEPVRRGATRSRSCAATGRPLAAGARCQSADAANLAPQRAVTPRRAAPDEI